MKKQLLGMLTGVVLLGAGSVLAQPTSLAPLSSEGILVGPMDYGNLRPQTREGYNMGPASSTGSFPSSSPYSGYSFGPRGQWETLRSNAQVTELPDGQPGVGGAGQSLPGESNGDRGR